jgi:type IV secretion system protein VirB4
LRKKNVAVVFATQSLADIERSSIAPALIESCPTRIFLPNDRALEPQAHAVYERFGLNARQIEILSRATPKRDYYAQTARGNRLFELGLGPVGLAVAGASSPDDQKLIDRLVAEAAPPNFAAAFLRTKGVGWAAELIEGGGLHPSPQPASPIKAPPALRPTPPPMPNVVAQKSVGTISQSPLPGLPGGPPMPERLSPFRVPEQKRKGERR